MEAGITVRPAAPERRLFVTGDFGMPTVRGVEVHHIKSPKSNDEIVKGLKGATDYIVGGPEYVSAEILNETRTLRRVVVLGTGTNSFVDLDAAEKSGVEVSNTPGINAAVVAEFALATTISCLAESFRSADILRNGGWFQTPHKTLADVSLGIVGMGDIGCRFAELIKAVSPETGIFYHSRTRKPSIEESAKAVRCSLEQLIGGCDVVVITASYNDSTHHLVNEHIFEMAAKGLKLLNFANPNIVDPAALSNWLARSEENFFYIDGYYDEWVANKGFDGDKHGLMKFGFAQFVGTTHIAAQSQKIVSQLLVCALQKLGIEMDT